MAKKYVEDESKIIECSFETVMHSSMMPYSEHVIMERALPRVEDGLKPVQRRILYSMMELGVTPDKPYRKCARIVGDCLGKYHPHGDSSVYEAMVKLAQPFNTGMTLVDGHGNFGSVDGDSAAAMRYTEAKLTPLAQEMLRDLDKETVSWSLNFDDSLSEPDILPGRYPNLLVNGAAGIAVGLATNIPPHNLGEVIDGIVAFIDAGGRIELDEMMKYIPAPDFPTGGLIIDSPEIRKAYETGNGKICMRAKARVEKDGDKDCIIVTEIPYQVNKATLLQKINELREEKKELFGAISDIIDESDRDGMRCVIKLRRDTDGEKILAALFNCSSLQCNFAANMYAIADGKPKLLSLMDYIRCYTEYQRTVVYRRSQFDLTAAKRRQHILQGLLIAVNNIRQVVDIIIDADSENDAKEKLKTTFALSEKQAVAVLDMKLRRLTKLDIGNLKEEIAALEEKIKELETILSSKRRQLAVVRREILEIKKKYAVKRRTVIVGEAQAKIEKIDLNAKIERKGILALTYEGNLKFMSERAYKAAFKKASDCAPCDLVKRVIEVSNELNVVAFTDKGNAVVFNVDALDDVKWKSKGTPLARIAKIDSDEKAVDVFYASALADKDLYFYTARAMLKRTAAAEFNLEKKAVSPAIILKEEDRLANVEIVDAACEYILMVSDGGMALNAFADVPQQGRKASGVRGMQLGENEKLTLCTQNKNEGEIAVINESGLGRRVIVPTIEPKRRFCKGVILNDASKSGEAIYVGLVTEARDIALVMPSGVCGAVNSEQLPIVESRSAKGKNIAKDLMKDTSSMVVAAAFDHNLM